MTDGWPRSVHWWLALADTIPDRAGAGEALDRALPDSEGEP